MAKYIHLGEGVTAFFTNTGDGSMSVKDDEKQGLESRMKVFGESGIDLKRAVFCQQTHSDNVYIVKEKDAGSGSKDFVSGIPDTDALLTDVRGVVLVILVADCVPVYIFDPIKKVIGIVHSGWKGTMKHVLEKTVRKMISQYGTDPKNIVATIAPSIGPDCFEVGEEVVVAAKEANLEKFIIHKDDKIYFDLWASNKFQLTQSGLKEENVKIARICNHCSSDYFSFRRDKNTNRFAAGIVLK